MISSKAKHVIRHGDWEIEGYNDYTYAILLRPIFEWILQDNQITPQLLNLYDIDHHKLAHDEKKLKRYRIADCRYPGMVITGTKTPNNKKYRMIDGRNRISKMKDRGETYGYFYVFSFEQVKPYIIMYDVGMSGRKLEEIYKYNNIETED